MNEAKLSDEERSRLYCRRFGYYDTNMFKIMTNFDKFKGPPKLILLNEDNLIADLAKMKRKFFKRNDPANTMDAPPFWKVMCDAYGGQESLGGSSIEGAIGG